MESPGFAERFSLPKVLIALISFLLVLLVGSCTNQQTDRPQRELPSDEQITEAIRSRFQAADEVPGENIKIKTEDGVVTLDGNTTNLLAKRKAKEIAQSAFGVLSVVNNLKITATRPDEAIDEDVERALATDPATEPWEITTEVNNGSVTLTGRTDSWQERRLAGTIASRVKGVKQVNNSIIITNPADRNDPEIKAEIEQKLKMNSQINGNMLKVEVADDTVKLSGAIGSAREKSLAKELAYVSGVESVEVDRLEVHPEYESKLFRNNSVENLTAEEIRKALNNALRYDPRVPRDSITVSIVEDVAILEGSVNNLNSKLAAAEDASNTAGISTVKNNITVKHRVVVTPDIPTTDEAIAKRIRYGIIRDPYVEEVADINISVDGGVAKLSGSIDSGFEKQQVQQIAENVKGIIAVNNDIEVKNKQSG